MRPQRFSPRRRDRPPSARSPCGCRRDDCKFRPVTCARYLDAGEAALVVEFGAEVDPDVNDRVLALDAALAALALDGVRETVPTYRSLMVHYDPLVLTRRALVEAIDGIEAVPI